MSEYIAEVLVQRSWVVHRVQWTLKEWIGRKRRPVLPVGWKLSARRPGPLAVIPTIERLRADAQQSPGGAVFLAHLLHPHGPFVYDGQCRTKPVQQWKDRMKEDRRNFDPAARQAWYVAYLEQVCCATQMFAEPFDELRDYPGFEDAVYLMHGDHGSRIAARRPSLIRSKDLSERDLLDSYSTLLAVRAPSMETGIDPRPTSINRTVASFWNVDYQGASSDGVWLIPVGKDSQVPLARLWPTTGNEDHPDPSDPTIWNKQRHFVPLRATPRL